MLTKALLVISLLISTNVLSAVDDTHLTEINVQLKWRHQFQFAGYYAAIEQGYYQEQGLKVNLLERKPGLTPIENLILGNVDYAIAGVGAMVYRINKVPIVAVAAIYQQSPSILISRFPKLQQLKNKKIMLSKGAMNAEITAMFSKEGLSTDNLHIQQNSLSVNEFSQHKIDAYNAYITNETYQLDKLNIPYYIFQPKDYGIDFYGDILYTMDDNIQKDRNTVTAFKMATIKGWQYAITHIDETIKLIQTKYNSQNKPYDRLAYEAKELIKLMHNDIVPIGYMSTSRWYDIAEVLQETGDIKTKDINLNGFIFDQSQSPSLHKILLQHYPKLTFGFILLIGCLLFIHYYHLKQTVKERTLELELAKEQAEQEARTDSLTGIANRRRFMEVMTTSLAIADRNDLMLSVIYIDIDWFKKINDTYGHSAGDKALAVLSDILKRNIRSSDTPARIGGEEFAVICFEKDQQTATQLAERIRKDVEKTIITYQNKQFSLTVSLGVACVENNEDIDTILTKSDGALYQAKKHGRNQVVCA